MSENTQPEETNSTKDQDMTLDLSELQTLNFGPKWGDNTAKIVKKSEHSDSKKQSARPRSRKPIRQQRDRRPLRTQRPEGPSPAILEKISIDIFPEDEPFKKLSQAIRRSNITYELFEIAHAILEKDDRYIILLQAKDKSAPIFFTPADKMPFLPESDAVAWFLKNHLQTLFTIEEVELEAPKGNFIAVSKCRKTGEILGPSNYHRYQQLLQEHHAIHFSHLPFEKFANGLETVKDEESINAWLEKMKKGKKYTFTGSPEGEEAPSFETLESVRHFLLSKHKDLVVKSTESLRIPGVLCQKMPNNPLKQAIKAYISLQHRFPLDTANNIRGRLRRLNFTIYKKGSKGISYVCGAKRKFRYPDTLFSESIQEVIKYLDENPLVKIDELEKHFGITPPLPLEPAQEGETEPEDEAVNTASESPQSIQLKADLKWLLEEGYIVKYSDGRLFANPFMEKKPEPSETPEEIAQASTEDNKLHSESPTEPSATPPVETTSDELDATLLEEKEETPAATQS